MRIRAGQRFPGSAVLRADGFNVYATQGQHEGRMLNIQVARSRDLVTWERLGDALPAKPAWASRTQDYWAPHVSRHGGRYYLYYSAKPDAALTDTSRGLCLAVATADRAAGPVDSGRQPMRDGFVKITRWPMDDRRPQAAALWGLGSADQGAGARPDRISAAPGSRPTDLVDVVRTGTGQYPGW